MTFWGALPRSAILSKVTQLENKEGDSSLRLRSVQNDAFSVTLFLTFTFLIVTLRRKPKGLLPFLSFRGGKTPRNLYYRFYREKIIKVWDSSVAYAPSEWQNKRGSEWPLFCHPEGFSPKGFLWGFFAIAQNDKQKGIRLCHERCERSIIPTSRQGYLRLDGFRVAIPFKWGQVFQRHPDRI